MSQVVDAAQIRETNQARWFLFAVALAIALTARLYFIFVEATSWWTGDSFLYAKQASAIIEGNWPSGAPNGYPLLIAALMALFGDRWDLAAILMNALLSCVIVALVFNLALDRSKSDRIAFIAALVAALWPSQLIWVRALHTEVPATFFLCCGLFLHWRKFDVLGALFLGAAIIIRPTLTPVVVVIAVALYFTNQKRRIVAVTILPAIILLAMQIPRPPPAPMSTGSFLAKNIMISNYGISKKSRDAFEYRNELVPEAVAIYFKTLADDPLKFATLRLGHFWELWGAWPDRLHGRGDGIPRSILRNAILGLQFPLFLLAIVAFFRRPDYLGILLVCPALVITVIHTGLFAIPRYNYPAIPFLIVLAADCVGVIAARFSIIRSR